MRTATVRVVIDENKCSGHGRCYTVSPDMFDCDDEGFPVVLVGTFEAGGAEEGWARTAQTSCPERAISVEDA